MTLLFVALLAVGLILERARPNLSANKSPETSSITPQCDQHDDDPDWLVLVNIDDTNRCDEHDTRDIGRHSPNVKSHDAHGTFASLWTIACSTQHSPGERHDDHDTRVNNGLDNVEPIDSSSAHQYDDLNGGTQNRSRGARAIHRPRDRRLDGQRPRVGIIPRDRSHA